MSRLGLGLGITKGGVIPFNPLSLDPYLLFDTQSSMIGTFENPTLDLDPSVPSTLDVITATRTGVATYTDADGLIQSATPNTVRVDQTQGAELTPTVYQYFSQTDFSNSYWSKRNSTITSGFSSPDGGNNAFKMVASQSDGDVFGSGVNTGNSHTKVVSVFAKAASATSKLRIQEQNYTGKRTEFDLNLGTITYSNSSGTSTIENIGDGWYRCAHVETYSTGFNTVAFALRSITADSLFLFGPQVEEGTTPTTFVPNTTGSPKFITGATFGPRVPMILVEPSATNLVDYSEAIGSNSFAKVGTTIDSNVTVSPDGTASADLLKDTDASGSHFMFKDLTLSSGQAYTISVFAKRNGVDRDLRLGDGGLGWSSGFTATFDLTEGTATSGGTIENIGNDWYRCSVTGTTNATTARLIVYSTLNGATSYQGDGESGIYLWGFQIEAGSLTSYIPTSGSTAQRAADDLSIDPDSTNLVTHSDFSGGWQEYLINSSAGSGYSLNASRVITSTGANAAYYIPVPTSNGATYTASIWARRVSGSGGCNIIYLSSPTAKQSISLTSEFQKFTATFTGKSGGGNVNFGVDIVTSGDSIEIAMPQVELGSSPTGFIPTSGAPASRTAFSDFYNQSEGTFYAEFEPRELSTSITNTAFELSNGTGAERILSHVDSQIHAYFVDGGNVQANLDGGTNTVGVLNRLALSYKANNIQVSVSGGAVVSDTSASIPTVDRLIIGNQVDDTTRLLNGHVKRFIYWPYHSDSL